MNVPSKDESHSSSKREMGPGRQLRKARERLGLDQADMATQLHLSQWMIEAIEIDNYEKLPGPVFVQGYLRNYSRLLGVNEEAIIEAYQRLLPVTDELPVVSYQDRKIVKELHSGHRVVRLVTWSILLVMAALLFFWWQTRVELEEPVFAPSEDQSLQTPQDLPADQSMSLPVPFGEGSVEIAPVQEAPDGVAGEATEPEPSAIETTSNLLDETGQTETVVVEIPQPEVAPVERVAAPPPKLVVFEFEESCWAEVRGQDGKSRIFGEMQPGAKRSLNSQLGPFSVVLGNAAAVKLTIDGIPFDLKPFTRGKVARFKLDPAQL